MAQQFMNSIAKSLSEAASMAFGRNPSNPSSSASIVLSRSNDVPADAPQSGGRRFIPSRQFENLFLSLLNI